MNEIIIDQKKYVSSKRAAEITGYAKDYVGQLCREGRVPARLVGRSWYVLESAIQDHRFGPTPHEAKPKETKDPHQEEAHTLSPTWESPHYEAIQEDALPHINRLRPQEPEQVPDESSKGEEYDAVARMRDSWKQWFADSTEEIVPEQEIEESELSPSEGEVDLVSETPSQESESVPVTIHAIHHPELMREPLQETPQMHILDERSEVEPPTRKRAPRTHRSVSYRALSALVYFVCFCSIVIGFAGSGVMDRMIITDAQVGFIAGISIYNK